MDVRKKSSNEKRLIDVDDLIDFIDMGHLRNPLESCFSERDVVDMLGSRPTVDAVEVVRCRDCKHRYSDSWCEYADDDDNFYCARGERKEGADNG